METRVSHILPTVTCSSCFQTIPIRDLSLHACTEMPLKQPPPRQTNLNDVIPLRKSNTVRSSIRSSRGETWKIAKKPTVTTSPLTALSRSVSIESQSPVTPVESQPFLAFRVAPSSTEQRETTLSFYKTDTPPIAMPSQLKPEALAHFQNHWKRFLQSSKPKPSCQRCHRPVSSKHLVSVKKQYSYHSHCLTCYLCCVPLKPNMEVRECNGHVYCSKHYELILSKPDCATCHTAIEPTTRPTKAFGVYFHLEHLKCCQCLRPVDEFANGIVRHKKRIYCRPHFNELYLPKCRGCGKAVEKESVSSSDGKLDGKFHKKCFRCHACQQPFADHTFYVYKNQPYCKHDYHQLNHSLCSKCKAPVEGRCAKTSDGQKFHPQCFQCHDCHQLIQDVYYTDNRNRIFCPNHSVDLQTDKRTTTFFDI